MSDPVTIQTVKLKYNDHEFSLIPSNILHHSIKRIMMEYALEIGDIAFMVDDELYFDEGALFNLTMKYCDDFIFI